MIAYMEHLFPESDYHVSMCKLRQFLLGSRQTIQSAPILRRNQCTPSKGHWTQLHWKMSEKEGNTPMTFIKYIFLVLGFLKSDEFFEIL